VKNNELLKSLKYDVNFSGDNFSAITEHLDFSVIDNAFRDLRRLLFQYDFNFLALIVDKIMAGQGLLFINSKRIIVKLPEAK
jgi:hypothetical protein